MNDLLIRAFVKKIKSENMNKNQNDKDNLIELKKELEEWESKVPVNNMGKWARQTKIDDLKSKIEKLSDDESEQNN